ncbi:hypothetical protein CPB84DRAFT_1845116 [Gymnopilus junonius]|uniref:Uncharacterized protein n=1 Tax=Gymnopilus junonius TaxID=109634 RepID=A0A9P5NSH4_GYMJU|nr:hypothetical protein CPB84DRAFT_1845116 [Gymnopilus junonius]
MNSYLEVFGQQAITTAFEMIPRFSNPHLLPQLTEIVSRSEIYASNDIDTNELTEYNSDLYSQFHKCFKYVLSQPHPEANLSRKRKREEEAVLENGTSQGLIPFRLVSSTLPPLPISILPPPPPPPLTREPDVEDDEEQALLRKWRAEAASLEAETILRESNTNKLLRHSDKTSKLRYLRATSDYTQTNLMIIRTPQRHRKTRPPIPLPNISAFPYVPDISTISLPPVQSRGNPVCGIKEK